MTIDVTLDDLPKEYLEDNNEQNEVPNSLNALQSPTQLDWVNDMIAGPLKWCPLSDYWATTCRPLIERLFRYLFLSQLGIQ